MEFSLGVSHYSNTNIPRHHHRTSELQLGGIERHNPGRHWSWRLFLPNFSIGPADPGDVQPIWHPCGTQKFWTKKNRRTDAAQHHGCIAGDRKEDPSVETGHFWTWDPMALGISPEVEEFTPEWCIAIGQSSLAKEILINIPSIHTHYISLYL